MLTVVVVIHLMIVLAMIGVVLLQKSEGGGLGMGGSGGGGFMSSRGTANVLTRTTALLAAGFFLTSLALSWLAGLDRQPTSIINTSGGATQEAPLSAPTAPLSSGGGVLNQLQQGSPGRPAAPGPAPAPSGPQVPESK